jgi:hypothetical protein
MRRKASQVDMGICRVSHPSEVQNASVVVQLLQTYQHNPVNEPNLWQCHQAFTLPSLRVLVHLATSKCLSDPLDSLLVDGDVATSIVQRLLAARPVCAVQHVLHAVRLAIMPDAGTLLSVTRTECGRVLVCAESVLDGRIKLLW